MNVYMYKHVDVTVKRTPKADVVTVIRRGVGVEAELKVAEIDYAKLVKEELDVVEAELKLC